MLILGAGGLGIWATAIRALCREFGATRVGEVILGIAVVLAILWWLSGRMWHSPHDEEA